jgi:predicted RNase H-like HicB family nuclease
MTSAHFTAVFERHGRWYVGYVPEVPGVNAQERTLAGARQTLTAALQELAEIDPAALRGTHRRIEQIEVRVSA